MSLPRLAVRRPVAVAMFFVAVVLLGGVSLWRMPVSLLPDVQYPRLVVWTTAAEVGPAEIERYVTRPIEEAVSAVPGVLAIESVSREGQSFVTVRFPWDTDMEFAQLHVRERLDNLTDRLPQSADRPTILRIDPGAEPILVASVTAVPPGGTKHEQDRPAVSLTELNRLAETVFKRRLEQLEGVGRALVVGGAEREIRVVIDPARLAAHGLTIEEVASALDRANASAPGGTIRRGRSRFTLRALGEFATLDQIEGTVVGRTEAGSGTIRVADVAVVSDTLAERESSAYHDGRPSVGLLIYRESGANAVAAAEKIEATFAELEDQYSGASIDTVTSQAGFISSAISNVVWALVLGGLLAFLVLFPFLHDPRWPAAIGLSMPISVAGAFILLYFSGVSLNIMTLGGLALGVGMLVDNSIVVLENTFRLREAGLPPEEAAARGAEEVQAAITASTVTTIAVFGPILYIEGLAGALFGELALAVAFALLASLLTAITLLPAILARVTAGTRAAASAAPVTGRSSIASRGMAAFERGFAGFAAWYEWALPWALDHRRRLFTWSAAALALAILIGLFLPRNVLPEVDQHSFRARLSLSPGTPFETTEALALRIGGWVRDQPETEAVLTRVGRASAAQVAEAQDRGPDTAVIDVRLSPGEGGSTADVMERLREAFAGLPPGALALETGAATELGALLGTAEADLAVEIRGAGLDTLRLVAAEVARRVESLPALADVGAGLEEGHPEIRITLDRDAIARYGLAVGDVVEALTNRTRGRVATEFVDFDRKVPIVVQPEEAERRDLERVLASEVEGVPLRLLVQVDETVGATAIRRASQQRLLRVTAEVAGGSLSGAIGEVEDALEGYEPPPGVEITVGGGSEELSRSFRSLGFAFLLAVGLVYMILAAEFESLRQPLIVLMTVPLAMIGAVLALAVTGNGFDTMSLIGIVILVGIVDNEAIVKVDFINQARARGAGLREAIEEAGRARLRPIAMTWITTILGLLPMAAGLGSGAELWAPFAIAVIGGLVTSTALTLLVVPAFYAWVESRPRSGKNFSTAAEN